jgi:phosphoribosylamine---glycine ligase
VIEFNCRLGDPETQVILPLLNMPLEDLMFACIEKRLEQMPPISWKPDASVCVIMATHGYPETSIGGAPISGIKKAEDMLVNVFQAGTKFKNNSLVTSGGRTLGVSATGKTLEAAIATAYKAISYINYDGAFYRSDIGS